MTVTEPGPATWRGLSFGPGGSGAADGALYLQPTGLLSGSLAVQACRNGGAEWLAGSALAFTGCAVIRRQGTQYSESLFDLASLRDLAKRQGSEESGMLEQRLRRLSRPRAPVAGLSVDRPLIMGVINVTPDSFSDGGDFADAADAIAQGVALLEAGADMLDIGGESTRPGAVPVEADAEIDRVVPVIRALAERGAVISIDTRNAPVMAAAVAAGARLINDITALTGDPESLSVAARSGATVVLMHMQGEPQTMQRDPHYDYAPLDVYDYLVARMAACEAAGIAAERIVLDPGIGFGKTVEHNFQIMERLALYHDLGCPVLLGVSRKSFIGRVSRGEEPRQRFPGSIAAGLAGLSQGMQILRVHDVAETFQARAVWQKLASCGQPPVGDSSP